MRGYENDNYSFARVISEMDGAIGVGLLSDPIGDIRILSCETRVKFGLKIPGSHLLVLLLLSLSLSLILRGVALVD